MAGTGAEVPRRQGSAVPMLGSREGTEARPADQVIPRRGVAGGTEATRPGGGTAHLLLDDSMHILQGGRCDRTPIGLRAKRSRNGSMLAIEEAGLPALPPPGGCFLPLFPTRRGVPLEEFDRVRKAVPST